LTGSALPALPAFPLCGDNILLSKFVAADAVRFVPVSKGEGIRRSLDKLKRGNGFEVPGIAARSIVALVMQLPARRHRTAISLKDNLGDSASSAVNCDHSVTAAAEFSSLPDPATFPIN